MKRGLPLDVERIADVLAVQVVAATRPLLERIKALEAREQEHLARISELEARKPEKGEPGRDGKDGVDGERGEDGAPGRDGIDGAKGETGERGLQGESGRDGQPGRDGRDGGQGIPGRDGVDGEDGHNGIDGKDGAPGLNGKDGTGWDDLIVEFDGERTFKFITVRGDQRKEHGSFVVPVMIYREVYKEGEPYAKGDVVTWAGSGWVCTKDTTEKPGDGSECWTLAIKKGRDGKDGVLKPAKPDGPVKM